MIKEALEAHERSIKRKEELRRARLSAAGKKAWKERKRLELDGAERRRALADQIAKDCAKELRSAKSADERARARLRASERRYLAGAYEK